jgi:major vault protein
LEIKNGAYNIINLLTIKKMALEGRSGDLVLSQGTYVLTQDGATGQVEVITGPHKVSLADTDKPVNYEKESRRFIPTSSERAITVCPSADEGQYLVLTNPSIDENGLKHPTKGKQSSIDLKMGRKINIQGPVVFALFPGQVAEVIDGHQLKSNEYLLIRVYNEKEAKENLKNSVIKTTEGTEEKEKKKNLFDEKEIRTGNLLIMKGIDVSFYMPPTGIEVLQNENGKYTRDAVTLERLEYCILLDQNGDKRYVKGPDVVFPKPTETFIENKNQRIFRAIELNENMGIYIKVIAEYEENSVKHAAGEELFITGSEQKIYFPRAEHAIIKYGDETIHYAVAVPSGEGRYILDKIKGEVTLVKGPIMLLPDPRKKVIVKRVLSDKIVNLWYPGNQEALLYNQKLKSVSELTSVEEAFDSKLKGSKITLYSSCAATYMDDEMQRKLEFTKPRSIKLDTKYDGAVLLNIWPNYAVQIINKTGERKVVEGPKIIMLEYDETLEVLELSTGKPKSDDNLMKTVYLQTKNNVVSDIIKVETQDLIPINIKIAYKINFEGINTKWFNVSDYVKLMTQHMRSLIRNVVKKQKVESFNDNATDIIRDAILGESIEGKRLGRTFAENSMKIYDVEVLELIIGDKEIASMLVDNQHDIVEQNLKIIKLNKDLEYSKLSEQIVRQKLDETLLTNTKKSEIELSTEDNTNKVLTSKINNKIALDKAQKEAEKQIQETIDAISLAENNREKMAEDINLSFEKERSALRIIEVEKQMAAIQPGLIEAMVSSNDVNLAKILAENIKEQKSGFNIGELFGGKSGGWEGIMQTIKGTPLEDRLKKIHDDYNALKTNQNK